MKKKKILKFVSAVLAAALTVGGITGCGGEKTALNCQNFQKIRGSFYYRE